MFRRSLTAVGAAIVMSIMASPAYAQFSVGNTLSISGSCSSCDLSSRNMMKISLNGADFSKSNFSHSNLTGGQFNQSNLTGAQFSRAFLMETHGERVNFRDAVLNNANLSFAEISHSDMSSTDLRRADLSGGNFKGTDFSQAIFVSGEAKGANFSDANFGLAKLDHTNFQDAIFIGAKLKHTEFGTANLAGADFTAADFSGANLTNVRGLTQKQLNQGCGNSNTQVPQGIGLSVPYCPEYLQIASSQNIMPRIRSSRTVVINGVDVTAQLDQIDMLKSGLKENIHTLDRAIAALPAKGTQAARAELQMSRAHLQRLYNGL